MTWGDCPHPETLTPPPPSSAHSVASWITWLPGYPIFLGRWVGPPKATFPEAKLERWRGGSLGERQAVLALLTRAWTLNPLLMAAATPPEGRVTVFCPVPLTLSPPYFPLSL